MNIYRIMCSTKYADGATMSRAWYVVSANAVQAITDLKEAVVGKEISSVEVVDFEKVNTSDQVIVSKE